MEKEEKKKSVSWVRPDFHYEHLYKMKMAISNYAGNNDMLGWYHGLETYYRETWEYFDSYRINDKDAEFYHKVFGTEDFDMGFFESQWDALKNLLYDPRLEDDSPSGERRVIKNYGEARRRLHYLNMILNKFSIKANLLIPRGALPNPSEAMARYGE